MDNLIAAPCTYMLFYYRSPFMTDMLVNGNYFFTAIFAVESFAKLAAMSPRYFFAVSYILFCFENLTYFLSDRDKDKSWENPENLRGSPLDVQGTMTSFTTKGSTKISLRFHLLNLKIISKNYSLENLENFNSNTKFG